MQKRPIVEFKIPVLFFGLLQIIVGIAGLLGGYFLLAQNGLTAAIVSEKIFEADPAAAYLTEALGLIFLIGLPFLAASWMTIRRVKYFGIVGLLLGTLLIAWNGVHFMSFGLFSIVQPIYMLMGVLTISMGIFFAQRLEPEDYRTFQPILR